MNEFDTQKAARVWQRVQGEMQAPAAPQHSDNLPALIMEQLQLSAAYLQLSRQVSGREGAEFMRLAREAIAQAVCLKGILSLMTGQPSETGIGPVQLSTLDAMLRRCYGRELRLLKEYDSRRTDAEYGPVFERMGERAREHCCAVLELIGKLGKA